MEEQKSLFWEEHITGDGSPTLSINQGEKMHSTEGAFSESLYIYNTCIEKIEAIAEPKVLSMGLGLGYNELIAVANSMTWNKSIHINSCEKLDFLRENFGQWLLGENSELGDIYSRILKLVANHFELNGDDLRNRSHEMYKEKKLVLSGGLEEVNPWPHKFHAICYDAYSSETDSYLWKQTFLEQFLAAYADESFSCLSTYAATGDLKRALKTLGFEVDVRKGFGMKRNSTFAIKK